MLYLIPELRRRRALRRCAAGALRDYLETPFPASPHHLQGLGPTSACPT